MTARKLYGARLQLYPDRVKGSLWGRGKNRLAVDVVSAEKADRTEKRTLILITARRPNSASAI